MIIEVKPSSKFDPCWWDFEKSEITSLGQVRSTGSTDTLESVFFTAVAQLHYYMAHSGADYAGPIYGVILTDGNLLPVKRDGSEWGKLEIGAAVPWTSYFRVGEKVTGFTVQSALWYLSMLASTPGWHYNGETVHRKPRPGLRRRDDQVHTKRNQQEDYVGRI